MLKRLVFLFLALGAIPDTATVLAKYKQRAGAAAQDYADGVARSDKDPTALAIQAGPRYLANVTARFNDGTWANGLRRSGKQGWQDAVARKGAANYSTGVANADAKFTSAFDKLLTFERGLQNQILGMSNVTDQDRRQRMNAWFDGLVGKNFKA